MTDKKRDFEYLRKIHTKFASAVLRPCNPFPAKSWDNTIIAEVKMSSPTKGRLARESDTPALIASEYLKGGAKALSVLTEPIHFEGSLGHIEDVRALSDTIPIMRKDFVVNKLQIDEARAFGADGILLISHIIPDRLEEFLSYVKSVGMWALVETHSEQDINLALNAGAQIIGVNNRNLETGVVDLDCSVELCRFIPENLLFVVESGIHYPEDIHYLRENCPRKPDAFLVGTSLVTDKYRMEKVKQLTEG